jgi:hypothetical protein
MEGYHKTNMESHLRAIEIKHCQCGQVASRVDGSVSIKFITPELRPSEAGALLLLHGKNVCVSIVPHDGPPAQTVRVDTERKVKSQSERLYAVLYVIWKQNPVGNFEDFRRARMETIIEETKRELPDA